MKTDGMGRVWYIGVGIKQAHVQAQLLGYLDPKTADVTYWELNGFTPLFDLFVDHSGEFAWVTMCAPSASGTMQLVPFLGRLDVAKGTFKYWSRAQPLQAGYGGARGIAADRSASPRNLWVTFEDGWGKYALRHEVKTGKFFQYQNPRPGWYPWKVALSGKTPWFSEWGSEKLSGKPKVKECEVPMIVQHASPVLSPIPDWVPVTRQQITPIPSSATLTPIQSTIIQSKCGFVDVDCPAPYSGDNLVVDSANMLFFNAGSGDRIMAFNV